MAGSTPSPTAICLLAKLHQYAGQHIVAITRCKCWQCSSHTVPFRFSFDTCCKCYFYSK